MSENASLTKLLGKPEFIPEKRIEAHALKIIHPHLERRRESATFFRITTDDLTTLIEANVADLSLYDDLSEYGYGVEGVTLFVPGQKPVVKISPSLSEPKNQNRFRSTLAHELGHVFLHDPMFQSKSCEGLFDSGRQGVQLSFRESDSIEEKSDLYEWQAWQFCRSVLMPRPEVEILVRTLRGDSFSEIWVKSDLGQTVVQSASIRFGVSEVFATIQLLKLGALTELEPAPTLF